MRLDDVLLEWYDSIYRRLPWRACPGEKPNPYHVLLSEIMLQQTTVATVISYFDYFIKKWPTLGDFAAATQDEVYHAWQGLGYYSRARNLHRCTRLIADNYQGLVPQDLEVLLTLPGIGPYTAAAIASIAYDKPVIPVDGNVIRIFSRFVHLETKLPQLQQEVREVVKEYIPRTRSGDFAQSLMDLGATICRPKNPLCQDCPIQRHCRASKLGIAHTLPRKKTKTPLPIRYGLVFWYTDKNGNVWLRRRPEKGLLANLMELPGTAWRAEAYEVKAEVKKYITCLDWTVLPEQVIHNFTHFQLRLTVIKATGDDQPGDILVATQELSAHPLPTLMKKIIVAVHKNFHK